MDTYEMNSFGASLLSHSGYSSDGGGEGEGWVGDESVEVI